MADERDDRKTQAYIDDALGRFLRIQDKVERSRYAWAHLRGMRRMGDDELCPPTQDPRPTGGYCAN